MRAHVLGFALALVVGCVTIPHDQARVAKTLSELGGDETRALSDAHIEVLGDHLAKDPFTCLPPVDEVLGPPPGPERTRLIRSQQPHYGWFRGPVHYRVGAADGMWRVTVNIVVEAEEGGTLGLADCELKDQLEGHVVCEGTPFEDDHGVDACPDSGRFEAPATRHNLRALLSRWSREAEAYWNRDAERFDLPVRYDFHFSLQGDAPRDPVDLVMPLWKSCGRTPYFLALRSGWSIPVLAHELGHYLGLLDEYEPLSGIVSFYPKTPFEGSEGSRMGLSMKTATAFYPLHHYLVLRRVHCDEPARHDGHPRILEPRDDIAPEVLRP